MHQQQPHQNKLSLTRRGLLRTSGIALGSWSLSAFFQPALAKKSALPMAPNTILTPSQNNPIRINFNENALGMSPKAQQAAHDAVAKAFRYADAEVSELKDLIASRYQLSTQHLLLTHGSTEGMRACMAAYAGPEVQCVVPELTYVDGARLAANAGMDIKKIPNQENWAFDLDEMKRTVALHKGPSVVYLVNPNNPTSTVTPSDQIDAWIKSKPANTMFVVDEAYAEFVNDPAYHSVDSLIKAGLNNVLLLKTFSKIHAMAGMRVGYVLSSPENIERVSNYVGTEDLNFCAVCAAAQSLQDTDFLAYSKASNDQSRKIMMNVMDELGITYLPSQTNFIFHRLKGPQPEYRKAMQEEHILIGRDFPPATNWARVSLGTPQEMQYVAQIMKKLRTHEII